MTRIRKVYSLNNPKVLPGLYRGKVVVDDGSKDRSGIICDSLALEDDRVIVIHQQNAGCSEARNAGIRASHGEYLIFVDSDDLWDDERGLEGIVQTISEHPGVDVVCFGVRTDVTLLTPLRPHFSPFPI